MVVVEFRSRLRPEADVAAYDTLSEHLRALATGHPGFLSIESYVAADGTHVSIEHFTDMDAVLSWRANPEHSAAQRRGREEFYASYEVLTCEVVRTFDFDASHATT